MPRTFTLVKGAIIERYGPGEQASNFHAGDFILSHGRQAGLYDGWAVHLTGLVARAMVRTRAVFSHNTEGIMPADLAKYYRLNHHRQERRKAKPCPP